MPLESPPNEAIQVEFNGKNYIHFVLCVLFPCFESQYFPNETAKNESLRTAF